MISSSGSTLCSHLSKLNLLCATLCLLASCESPLTQPSPSQLSIHNSVKRRLKRHPISLRALKRHPQLKQLNNDIPELLKERPVILGIPLHMLPEHRILHQRHIRRQHHQRLRLDILILLRPIPLPPPPLLIQQQPEVIIRHDRRTERPRALEAGAIGMAAPERVRARQRHNLAVIETHAPEYSAQMRLVLRPVREAPVGRAKRHRLVQPARAPGDLRALHFLDGCHAGEGPEVGVGDPGELLLDGVEEVAGGFEACVGAVVAFGGEAHGGSIRPTRVGCFVVGAAAVPGQADYDRTVGAIVVVVFLFEEGGDGVVYFLVVFLVWSEGTACLA